MKNAGSSKESCPSSTSGTSDSSCSVKSTEMANIELDAESAATRELIQADDREEKGESIVDGGTHIMCSYLWLNQGLSILRISPSSKQT